MQQGNFLFSLLFPRKSRFFYGKRWFNIILRTLHLIGISGVGGAFLYHASTDVWMPYMILTIVSGTIMAALEIWTNGIWLVQLRGLATILKLAILSLTFLVGLKAYILIPVIAISGIIAHAPANVRYYSFFLSDYNNHLSHKKNHF